jgi:hypothetical protein
MAAMIQMTGDWREPELPELRLAVAVLAQAFNDLRAQDRYTRAWFKYPQSNLCFWAETLGLDHMVLRELALGEHIGRVTREGHVTSREYKRKVK